MDSIPLALRAPLQLRSDWDVSHTDIVRLNDPARAVMVNGAIPLSAATVDALLDYSRSLPSGTGEGKVWKRAGPSRSGWYLGRYGTPYPDDHMYAGQVPIGWWPIHIEGQPAAFPRDVRVPSPVMRGRPIDYIPPPPELPDGVWEGCDGILYFTCRGCDQTMPLECDLDEFDTDMPYCGGSPRCLP